MRATRKGLVGWCYVTLLPTRVRHPREFSVTRTKNDAESGQDFGPLGAILAERLEHLGIPFGTRNITRLFVLALFTCISRMKLISWKEATSHHCKGSTIPKF